MFSFHEFSTALLSMHVIYAVGISGHVLNHFLRLEDHVVMDACGERKKCFLPLTRFYSNVHVHILACAHIHTHSLIKARTFSVCFLYFPWRIMSQKSTFNGKSLRFEHNTNTHRNTRTHPRTSTHRKYKNWRIRKRSLFWQEVTLCATADSHNYSSRDCGFRPTTTQRDGRKMYTKAKWIRGRSVFLIIFSFYSLSTIDACY